MEFRIRGVLEVGDVVGTVSRGPPKQRAVLALLLLHAGEVVSVDRLVEALWPTGAPRTAVHSIQIYVSELRKARRPVVGRDPIVTRAPGYAIVVDDDAIDARRFVRLLDEADTHARAGDDERAIAVLREALDLWQGPVLADFAYDDFAQRHIRRLNDRHLDALERLADAELQAGRPTDALTAAEAAIAEGRWRERARSTAMLALYRLGRQPEALRTYEHLRRHLRDELGLEPSPWLQRVQEAILLHDGDADGPAHPRAVAPQPGHNPYKGLQSFDESDAAEFFGRQALVSELLAALERGSRLIALVGPSGSGKPSVLFAGVVPRLRRGAIPGSDARRIVRVASDRGAIGVLDEVLTTPPTDGLRSLLVLDQFEDLFAGDDAVTRQVLRSLTSIVTGDVDVSVVVAMRADFYDRPLLDPDFAAVFVPSVVNVVPLTTTELEEAVVRPAASTGCLVEPDLVAELLAATASQPGSLPLVQYTLTELYERRMSERLTLDDYRALGGLRGLLSRQADEVYCGLDHEAQQAAMQVFLRLVRPQPDQIDVHRRVAVVELADLGVDVVALSTVLDSFGRHRLLTFDRDPATGGATVDVAHEALLREWERLRGWLTHYRAALRRLMALAAATEEWEQAGRNLDYLLIGSRLDDYDMSSLGSAIRLTSGERALLEASRERRALKRAADMQRDDAAARLHRRSRSRLAALVVALVALAGVVVYVALRPQASPASVALVESAGQFAWIQVIEQGFERAVNERGLPSRKVAVVDGLTANDAARSLSDQGSDLVVVTALDAAVDLVAEEHPNVHYAVIDQVSRLPNVTRMVFAVNEASFLAGVIAASKTQTRAVAFLGGVDSAVIWPWAAGFEAGVRAVPGHRGIDPVPRCHWQPGLQRYRRCQ